MFTVDNQTYFTFIDEKPDCRRCDAEGGCDRCGEENNWQFYMREVRKDELICSGTQFAT